MIWLVLDMARRRGSWFLFALPLFALGGLVLWITHPLHFVRVGGAVASYREVTTFTNSYDHNELRLVGDPQTYKLDKWSLHPRLLEGAPVGASVSLWVEPGNTWVEGIAIGETTAARPQRVTDTYASPGDAVRNNYIGASVFLGAGVLLCLNGLLWTVLPWNRAPRSRYTPTYMPTYPMPSDDQLGR